AELAEEPRRDLAARALPGAADERGELPGGRRDKLAEHRAAMALAARFAGDAGEPELEPRHPEILEQAEADRRLPLARRVNVARDVRLRAQRAVRSGSLEEAGRERQVQVREKQTGLRRIVGDSRLEAAVLRALAQQAMDQRGMGGRCRMKHRTILRRLGPGGA